MKRIEEMTKEEILALTTEEIDKMVDYACAERGIPLLPPIPEEPEYFDIKAHLNLTVYELGNFTFVNKEDAEKVYNVMLGCPLINTTYISGPSYEMRFNGNDEIPDVKVRRIFSEGAWTSVKDKAAKAEAAKKEYQEARDYYNEVYSQRKEVVDEIMEVVNETNREQRNLERHISEFERYLELAEGDRNIAINFFEKAYPGVLGRYPIATQSDVSRCDCSEE